MAGMRRVPAAGVGPEWRECGGCRLRAWALNGGNAGGSGSGRGPLKAGARQGSANGRGSRRKESAGPDPGFSLDRASAPRSCVSARPYRPLKLLQDGCANLLNNPALKA
jgi:hypothetical protein